MLTDDFYRVKVARFGFFFLPFIDIDISLLLLLLLLRLSGLAATHVKEGKAGLQRCPFGDRGLFVGVLIGGN